MRKEHTTTTTLIKNADWIVAYDVKMQTHKYLRNADLAFKGDTITYVGKQYNGQADTIIDGKNRLIIPGLLNLHLHAYQEIHGKGFFEDLASKHMWMTQLFEYTWLIQEDQESAVAAIQASACDLLKSGCTTMAELYCSQKLPFDGWLSALADTGIRTYACPMVNSGHWYTPDGRNHKYKWDEAKGLADLEGALDLIDTAETHSSGRLHGMIGAAQVDTCTEELFLKCKQAAMDRGIPLQTHAAQSVMEHREMIRRHRKTPLEWLDDIGILGPQTLIGHAINIDQHPWINHYEHKDLERLATSGASVVHCPRAFAQWGDMMRSLGGYRQAGVNMALGTDCYPHDMIEEMRIAGLLSKVASGNVDLLRTEHIFEIATLGAAKALGRDDLGRLSENAKADIVMIDLKHPSMRPVRDPLRSLIYSGVASAVQDVYVNGEQMVQNGIVLTMDQNEVHDRLQTGQDRSLARVSGIDWAGRTADEVNPICLTVE
ncbi:MAG: 5-methylthioadenosine/S-adenosylhomocysteine deaminase [Parasphingorhabdus sp.]|jgi:5-methylthioadenosine/S-adenosylhomocysteine deaminase